MNTPAAFSSVPLQRQDGDAPSAASYHRFILQQLPHAFCVGDVLCDEHGTAVNYRLVEVNAAFEQQFPLPNPVGHTLRELAPAPEASWYERLGQVARTGQAVHFEQQVPYGDNSWYEVQALPTGPPGSHQVALLLTDITTRCQTETALRSSQDQQVFLVRLGDELRPLSDVAQVQAVAARLLGQHLRANQVHYGETQGDDVVISQGYGDGLPAMTGRFRSVDFGERLTATHRAGVVQVVRDIETDAANTEAERQVLRQAHIGAYLTVPLVKEGQWVATLAVHSLTPRPWTADEVRLVEDVAERTWAAVERARAEAARRESEALLQKAFAIDTVGTHFFTLAGRSTAANAAFARMSGYRREELLAMDWNALTPAEFKDVTARASRELADQGETAPYEKQLVRADGSRGWALCAPIRLQGHGPTAECMEFVLDISERKQAEEQLRTFAASLEALVAERTQALQASHARLNTIFEAVPLQLSYYEAVRDAGGQLVDLRAVAVNAASADKMSLPDEAPGLLMSAQLPGLRELPVWQTIAQVIETGQPQRLELHHAFGAGEGGWFDVLYTRLGDGLINASLDITARKHLEQALREDHDLLQSIFDTSLVGLAVQEAVRDAHGTIQDFRLLFVNRELERESGRADLVGKHFVQGYPDMQASGLFELMCAAVETGEPQHTEYSHSHNGLPNWYACTFVKLNDGLMTTNLDITPRKLAEEERFRNFALLHQAEEVAGLGSWDYDLTTRAFQWSDGMYRLFDLPPGTPVTPQAYLAVAVAEDRPIAERLVHQLLQEPSDFEQLLRVQVAGEVRTIRIKAVVLRDGAGQPERVLGVNLDISQVQRLETENLHLRLTQQQQLFEAVQQAQETERKRICEGMHNGVGQLLFATRLRLDQLHDPVLDAKPGLAAARQEAGRLLAEAIRQTRILSHELVPLVLEEFGLAAALQDVCHQLSTGQLPLHCHVGLDEDMPPLPPLLQLALYRMAQELGLNIVKHAHGATQASLELETTPGFVLLRAEDNGTGFATDPAASMRRGLRTIRDRVALLNGILEVGHHAGVGTFVRLRLPLPTAPTTDFQAR